MAGLQLLKAGQSKFPNSHEIMSLANANSDMQRVLDNGIKCLVWDWSVVQNRKDEFLAMMSAANTRGRTDMMEDELLVAWRMQRAWAFLKNPPKGAPVATAPVGSTQFERVLTRVKRHGPLAFNDEDCKCIWQFVCVVPPELLLLYKKLGSTTLWQMPSCGACSHLFLKN